MKHRFPGTAAVTYQTHLNHNVPAWTIFAMFFVVISLAGSIVPEKLSGSFYTFKNLTYQLFYSLTIQTGNLFNSYFIASLGYFRNRYLGIPYYSVYRP